MIQFIPSRTDLARQVGERSLTELVREFGSETAITELGWPAPEAWAAERLGPDETLESLDSLPFRSLCTAVIGPLMTLAVSRQEQLFGRAIPAWNRENRQVKLKEFFAADVGLSAMEKVCWVSGDRLGTGSSWSEDRLLKLLSQSYFVPYEELRKKMLDAGGVGALAAQISAEFRPDNPLASRVVTMCLLHPPPVNHPCWPDLLKRCSALERYILVSHLGGKLDLHWNGRQEALIGILAEHYAVSAEQLKVASALEDLPRLVERLEEDGAEGLKAVVLRPLIPLRPALAVTLEEPKFPCWVECKYDGIRLLLHKELDSIGKLRVAAFTRRRNDWSELLARLEPLLAGLPAHSVILDGELHGRVLEASGVARPATVYEVHAALRGESNLPLRYVAFDLLYLNGKDLTGVPLQLRRAQLEALIALVQPGRGLPIELSQGSLATSGEQLNRLYQQYRQRGHEGCMVKDPSAPYPLGLRTSAWQKRKPLETVDLVLTAAYWGEGARPGAQLFDSYELSARHEGGWKVVSYVGAVDAQATSQIVGEVWRLGLLTGAPRERQGSRSKSQGVEVRPYLVVTVAYEDLLWEAETGQVTLRSGRIQGLRSGDVPLEESTPYSHLEKMASHRRLR